MRHTMTSTAFERASGTLDERLAAALGKVALAARHYLRQRASDHGLSAVQAQALTLLARQGPAEVGSLASRLGLTMATVSDSVAALERRGLVRRRQMLRDRRRIEVRATASGKRLGLALALWPEVFQEGIGGLPEAEKAVLFRALTRIILFLLEQGVIQEAGMCVTCAHFRPNVHRDALQPHHCALVDVPLGPSTLRLDCPDQGPGTAPAAVLEKLDSWLGVAP